MDVLKRFQIPFLRCIFGMVIFATIAGCGGGGDDSSGAGYQPGSQPKREPIVGGTVSAPSTKTFINASSASNIRVNPSALSANSALTGAVLVPDGTVVELAKLDAYANIVEIISSTKTADGKYSFDLDELGIGYASNLIVRVLNESTFEQMRAFLTYGVVDIDPVTEATIRLLASEEWLGETSGIDLEDLSTLDLTRITAANQLVVRMLNLAVQTDVETTVNGVMAAMPAYYRANHHGFSEYGGDSEAGPGDIGGYFPTALGIEWTYAVTESERGIRGSSNYAKYVRTTRQAGNIYSEPTTVFEETNSLGSRTHERFLTSMRNQLAESEYWGQDENVTEAWHSPYPASFFPPVVGFTRDQFDDALGVPDIDGDEYFDSNYNRSGSDLTVLGFETIGVPAGTFSDVLKVKTVRIIERENSDGTVHPLDESSVIEWYAPGVGLIKKVSQTRAGGYAGSLRTTTEILSAVSGIQLPAGNAITLVPVRANGIVYDKFRDRIYASVPSTGGRTGNTITVINPNTAQIESSTPVGPDPGALALSRDGSRLYVGLNGSESIRTVKANTMEPGMQFELGKDHLGRALIAHEIEVSPDDASVIAVSKVLGNDRYTHAGVTIFDDGIKRLNESGGWGSIKLYKTIEFSDRGDTLYGLSVIFGEIYFSIAKVDESGLASSETSQLMLSRYAQLKFDRDQIFTTFGELIDPRSKSLTGKFDLDRIEDCNAYTLVEPEVVLSRVFFLTCDAQLRVYDLDTFQLLSTLEIPYPGRSHSLVRVGKNKIAFASEGNIYLIDLLLMN